MTPSISGWTGRPRSQRACLVEILAVSPGSPRTDAGVKNEKLDGAECRGGSLAQLCPGMRVADVGCGRDDIGPGVVFANELLLGGLESLGVYVYEENVHALAATELCNGQADARCAARDEGRGSGCEDGGCGHVGVGLWT